MSHSKTKFARATEIGMNLSIMLVALVGATVLVKTYLLRPTVPATSEVNPTQPGRNPDDARVVRTSTAPPRTPEEGTQLSVPGVSWGDSNQTIVLALSDKCHYCSESAPFYQ